MISTGLFKDISPYRGDVSILVCLGLAASLGFFLLARQLDNVLVSAQGIDFWFQSDTARVFWNMSDPASDHNRATVHPLFSLFTTPLVLACCKVFAIDRLSAVRMMMALVAGAWSMLIYILLRLIGLLRFDALLFSCLALVSSASLFWFSVPETFSFGSLSILFALILLARSATEKPAGEWAFILAEITTLGFTVTNWMVGLLASFLSLPWKKAVRSNLIAVFFVALLSYSQRLFFNSVPFFVGRMDRHFASSADEIDFLFMEETGGPVRSLVSFFHHSIIMPGINYVDKLHRTDWKILSVQFSPLFSGNIVGVVAGVFWALLLGVGFWSLATVKKDWRMRLGLALALLGQLTLHLVYGDETFLYAMHYMPLLIIIAAYGTLSSMRKTVLVIAGIVCIGAAVNNISQFCWAVDMLNTHFHVQGQ